METELRGSEMGVTTGFSWAWCNACEWRGPDRAIKQWARNDLDLHVDTPGHSAQLTGSGGSDGV